MENWACMEGLVGTTCLCALSTWPMPGVWQGAGEASDPLWDGGGGSGRWGVLMDLKV